MKAVNLLPSEQRGSSRSTRSAVAPEKAGPPPFGAYVVLGLLAFAVLATTLTVLAGNTNTERKAELARVTAEAQAVGSKAVALQAYADFDGLAQKRVDTVRGLAGSRFDWQRALTDLSRALPGDVHLRSVEGARAAAADGAAAGSVSAPTIKLSGCTSSQTAVATLMSRLRNIRGVTRVALHESSKVSASSPSQPAVAGEGTPASLCPKGSPPDFDLTMYFERAALPAGATVNGSAAAAAAGGAGASATGAAAATPAATPAPGTTTTTSTQGTSE